MSMSQNSSSSSSVPTVTETPENSIIDQLSGVAAGLANQMYSWAQGVYAQTSAITNQTVGNFFQVSQNMLGLSNNMTNQYNNLFAPENAQLVADANSYNSTARQQVDMGQAGATQAQAGAQGLANSEEALRSFGIDPSSGRYAALDKAAAVQNAANVAGAENTQRNADVATGQRLRSEAVQVGAQLPAAIANVNNTAIQANTGAENATLGNANTGANLMKLPNDYLNTAMNVKLPLSGQTSQSKSSGTSSSPEKPSPPSSGGGGQGGGGGGNPFGPSGPAWMPNHGGTDATTSSGGRANPRQGGSNAAINNNLDPNKGNPDDFNDPSGNAYGSATDGIDPNSFNGNDNIYQPQDGYGMGVGQAGTNDPFQDYNNPFGDSGFGQNLPSDQFGGADQTFGGMGGGTNTEFGNISYDPNQNNQGAANDWANTYDQPVQTDWGNGADQYGGGSPDYSNSSGGGYDTSSPDSSYYAGDYSSPVDNSSYDMGGAYARGGPIAPAGGQIPQSMSPSGGQRTDDIRAQGPGGRPLHMNANEFVIPQDVALWKGQEFFQNLIDQSRKKRVMAPAKPTVTGAQPQPGMR